MLLSFTHWTVPSNRKVRYFIRTTERKNKFSEQNFRIHALNYFFILRFSVFWECNIVCHHHFQILINNYSAIHPPLHHPTYCSVESQIYCYVETFETELTICDDWGANPDITSNRAALYPLDQKVFLNYYDKMFGKSFILKNIDNELFSI